MALRSDERSYLIYQPDNAASAMLAIEAASLIMFGAWLQSINGQLPGPLREPLGVIGDVSYKAGDARQQIYAGLSKTDVPNELVTAMRHWGAFAQWREDPKSIPFSTVHRALDELSGALKYIDQRNMEHGTDHPRWSARVLTGIPCDKCGR